MVNLVALGISSAVGLGLYTLKDMWDNRDITELKQEWDKILLETHTQGIRNRSGQTYSLLKIKRIENGYRCKSLPIHGIDIAALENAKGILETKLNAKISINKSWDNKWITIDIIKNKPLYVFTPIKCPNNKLFLGYKMDGTPFLIDIDENPHIGLTGMTGTGKSVVKSICITNLLYNWKKDFDTYLCQIVNNDDMIFAKHPSVKMTATTLEEAKVMLEKLLNIADRRNEEFKSIGCINFKQYNKHCEKGQAKKRIFLILDEFSFFAIEDGEEEETKKLKQETKKIFKRLAKAGRAMGIHLICALQRLAVDGNIDANIRSQLSILSLYQRNNIDSNMAIGTNDATRLEKREGIFNGQGIYEYLFMPVIKGLEKDFTLQEYVHQFIPSIDIPRNNNQAKTTNITENTPKKDDIWEQTNKLRVPKSEQQWDKEDKGNVIALKEIATGSARGNVLKGEYDHEILKHMEKFKIMSTKQCMRLFYGNKMSATRRLKILVDKGILGTCKHASKERPNIIENIYFVGQEPSQKHLTHELMIRDFYCRLVEENINIIDFQITPTIIKHIVPDALIRYKKGNNEHLIALEVDYTHFTGSDKKVLYEKYYRENLKNTSFTLLIMSDKKLNPMSSNLFPIKYTNPKMDNFTQIFI